MNLSVLAKNIGGENMKFRNCFFEYDGVYSGKYNLRLVYVENSNHNFDSGGGFDFKFGQIPYSHEQLYYGKDYSANPLQFEIEILNVDGYISESQMIEIKEWLFGGNGWKKFKPLNGTNNKSLRCILTPIADITEGNHYKGLRFSLRNASPFWYGEEKTIEASDYWKSENTILINGSNYNVISVDIPNNDEVNTYIYPDISITVNKTNGEFLNADVKEFRLFSCEANSIADGKGKTNDTLNYPNTSEIRFDISYLGDKGDSNAYDNISINTRYVTVNSERFSSLDISPIIDSSKPLPIFKMKYGTNILRLRYGWNYTNITFKYTPLYRMGAF